MTSTMKEDSYSVLENIEDLDLENDTDTTLASERFLQKNKKTGINRSSQPQQGTKQQRALTWIRWSTVVFLQITIVFMLQRLPRQQKEKSWTEVDTETGGDINGLYIPLSHKYTLLTPDEERFVPNMTSNDDRMAIRHNWDLLMPLGSGSIEIPDWKQHPMLGKPIVTDPIHKGAVFEASWTHALHCLYYTVDTYHQLVVNGSFGFDGERNDYHAAHCFEYLRNQILCMADMTLEGSESLLDATGEGQAHVCRNREEAIEWIEARRMDDLQSIVGP